MRTTFLAETGTSLLNATPTSATLLTEVIDTSQTSSKSLKTLLKR